MELPLTGQLKMSNLRLIITLVSIVAVLIVAIAVYVFTHLSGINFTQGAILIAIAVVALFLVMGIIIILMKSLTTRK